MDLKRLRRVKDICPLLVPQHASMTASRWIMPVAARNRPVVGYKNGHTVALFCNRLLTWHRSFTRDCTPPPAFEPASYIYVHEWIADAFPAKHEGWRVFGFASKQGVTFLQPGADYRREWSDHARRHLKTFKKSGANLRFGTVAEFKKYSRDCYLGEDVLAHTIEQTDSILAEHPEDLEILVAETTDGEPLGFFISANCDEVSQSYYVGGFYTAAGARAQAMTGLIDWWFALSVARGYWSVNFGDMSGPRTPWFDPAIGYSNFKTHFGIHRVWRPRTLWKIRLRFRNLDAVREFVSE